MTFTLVRKLLRDSRWPLLVVCLLLFVFSLIWVGIAKKVTTEIGKLPASAGTLDSLKASKPAMEALDAALTDEQKKKADQLLAGRCGRM